MVEFFVLAYDPDDFGEYFTQVSAEALPPKGASLHIAEVHMVVYDHVYLFADTAPGRIFVKVKVEDAPRWKDGWPDPWQSGSMGATLAFLKEQQ